MPRILTVFVISIALLGCATTPVQANCESLPQNTEFKIKTQRQITTCTHRKKNGKSTFITHKDDREKGNKAAPARPSQPPNQNTDNNNDLGNGNDNGNDNQDNTKDDKDDADTAKNENQTDDFRVVLQTKYANMPSEEAIRDMGFDRVKLLTSWFFYPRSDLKPQLDDTIRAHIKRNTERYMEDGKEYVLDIEHLPINMKATKAEREDSMNQLLEIMEIIRSVRPTVKLGYYAFPIRQYWMVYANCAWNQARHQLCTDKQKNWHDANTQLLPLIEASDFIAPSIYTFYDKPDGWANYAKANLKEAKRLSELAGGKPTYAYLWPRFHGSNKNLGYRLISPAFWRMQLELVAAENIDGIVIWDHWPHRDFAKVKSDDPWFTQTLDFMSASQK